MADYRIFTFTVIALGVISTALLTAALLLD
jgi:hypothetical protein